MAMVMLFNTKSTQCVVIVMVLGLFLFANSTKLDRVSAQEEESIKGLYIMHSKEEIKAIELSVDDWHGNIVITGEFEENSEIEFTNQKIETTELDGEKFPNIQYSLNHEDTFLAVSDDGSIYKYHKLVKGGYQVLTTYLKVTIPTTTIEEKTSVKERIQSAIDLHKKSTTTLNEDREIRNAYIKEHFKQFFQQPLPSNAHAPKSTLNSDKQPALNAPGPKLIPNYDDLCIFLYLFIVIAIILGTYAGLKRWRRNPQGYDDEDDEEVSDEDDLLTTDDDEEENKESDESIDNGDKKGNNENDGVTSDEEGKVNEKSDEIIDSIDEDESKENEEGNVKKDEERKESIDSGDKKVNRKSEGGNDKKVNQKSRNGIARDDEDDSSSDFLDFLEAEGQLPIPAHMFLHNDSTQPQYL